MMTFSWCIVPGWQRHSRVENLGWISSFCKADHLMPRVDDDEEEKNYDYGDLKRMSFFALVGYGFFVMMIMRRMVMICC